LTIIHHIDFLPHKFLVCIVSHPIIFFKKLRIFNAEDIEDRAIEESIVLKLSSLFFPNYLEDVESVEQDLFLLVSGDIN
jgi:hypothetical protein